MCACLWIRISWKAPLCLFFRYSDFWAILRWKPAMGWKQRKKHEVDDRRITNVLRARIYCGTPFYCVHAAVSDAPIRSGGVLKLRTTLKRQTRQKSICRPFSFIRGERWLWPGKTGSQLRGHRFPYHLGTIGDVRHPPGGVCKTRIARYLTPGSPHEADVITSSFAVPARIGYTLSWERTLICVVTAVVCSRCRKPSSRRCCRPQGEFGLRGGRRGRGLVREKGRALPFSLQFWFL